MSAYSTLGLQQAMYSVLNGDVSLSSIVTGTYDHVPPEAEYPFIVIGEFHCRDWSTATTNGMEATAAIHVYSREAGHTETQEIMQRIYELLHNTHPSISGHEVINLRFLSSTVVLENDGFTYHGIMRLRAVTESTS